MIKWKRRSRTMRTRIEGSRMGMPPKCFFPTGQPRFYSRTEASTEEIGFRGSRVDGPLRSDDGCAVHLDVVRLPCVATRYSAVSALLARQKKTSLVFRPGQPLCSARPAPSGKSHIPLEHAESHSEGIARSEPSTRRFNDRT